MPPCSYSLTFLALSINRIPEVDQKRSERWRGISTRCRDVWASRIPQRPVLLTTEAKRTAVVAINSTVTFTQAVEI